MGDGGLSVPMQILFWPGNYFHMIILYFVTLLIVVDALEVSSSIDWKPYKSRFLKGQIADFYRHRWHAEVRVPMSHQPIHRQPAEIRGRTLKVYVRKFSHGLVAKNHIWMISGGPGTSSSGIERALAVLLPDTAIYLMDNRGLGRSDRLCYYSEAGQCFSDPKYCYEKLEFPSNVISMHETAKDYNYLSNLIKRLDGGQVFLYGSSYGATLAYRSFHYAPFLYSGILLEGFMPKFRLGDFGDVREHLINLCQRSKYCQEAFPLKSKEDINGLMATIFDPANKNQCKTSVVFVAKQLNMSLKTCLTSYIRAVLYRNRDLRPDILPFLYDVAHCPSIDKFNERLRAFSGTYNYEDHGADGGGNGSRKAEDGGLLLRSGLLNARLHTTTDSRLNKFFSGHIRFSEFAAKKSDVLRACLDQGYINIDSWIDECELVSSYKPEFEPYLYEPDDYEASWDDLSQTLTRVIVAVGRLDSQTPYDVSLKEYNRLPVVDKHFFAADYAGHGIIDSRDVDGLSLGLVLSYLMNGRNSDLAQIRQILKTHNDEVEGFWKTATEKSWNFKSESRRYSWECFVIALLGMLVPPLLTLYGRVLFNVRNEEKVGKKGGGESP